MCPDYFTQTRAQCCVKMGEKEGDGDPNGIPEAFANMGRDKLEQLILDQTGEKCDHDSQTSKSTNKAKETAMLILPHLALVVATCVYGCVGSAIFCHYEGPAELRQKSEILANVKYIQEAVSDHIYDRLINLTDMEHLELYKNDSGGNDSYVQWELVAGAQLDLLIHETLLAFENSKITAEDINLNTTATAWTFASGFFFSIIVMTTIGYGDMVPRTLQGRIVCIIYALVGIPLTLITIADIGKFVSTSVTYLHKNYSCIRQRIEDRIRAGITQHGLKHSMMGLQNQMIAVTGIIPINNDPDSPSTEDSGSFPDELKDIDELDISPSFFVVILIAYTLFGAVLFAFWENWSFVDSAYFCFISITTVGFGDLAPSPNGSYLFAALLYIIFGLVLATMCIDLVGSHYITKIHYFGRKINTAGDAFAFLNQNLAEMQYLRAMKRRLGLTNEELYEMLRGNPFVPTGMSGIQWIDEDISTPGIDGVDVPSPTSQMMHQTDGYTNHNNNNNNNCIAIVRDSISDYND